MGSESYWHDKIDGLDAEIRRLNGVIDKLLDHCPDGECHECSAAVCPHGCLLHFHHDGCPACAQNEDDGHDL